MFLSTRFRYALLAVLVAVLLSVGAVTAADNAQSISQFVRINTQHLTVSRTTTLTGAASLASTLDVVGATELGAGLAFTPQSATTVTNGGSITPAGVYVPLTSSGNVGTSSVVTTSATAGDIAIFVNTANTTITISDTTPLRLTGNIALGQYDTLTLLFDGSTWNQLATSNN